ERIFKQTTRFQIIEQCSNGLVDLLAAIGETKIERLRATRAMGVPTPVIQLDKAHVSLCEATGEQAVVREALGSGLCAISGMNALRLLAEIERVACVQLHAESHLILGYARQRLGIAGFRVTCTVH